MRSSYILAALFLSCTSASAATLSFDGDICAGGTSCSNGETVDQSYGDLTGVDVIYDAYVSTAAQENLSYWGTGYETLTGVVYGFSGGGGASITFEAMAGYEVSVGGFDLAPYANRVRTTQVTISELGGGVLYSTGPFVADTSDVTHFADVYTSTSGIVLTFGPDAYDIGVDNIEYSASLVETPAPVPLPASAVLLLGALGGLGAMRKRS